MDYSIQRGRTIILRSGKKVRQINIESIIYVSYDSFVISIFLQNQKRPETLVATLKEMEYQLTEFYFVRINRNQLVNLKYFRSISSGARNINLVNNISLDVSRRRMIELKRIL